jgi:hypothetical protein
MYTLVKTVEKVLDYLKKQQDLIKEELKREDLDYLYNKILEEFSSKLKEDVFLQKHLLNVIKLENNRSPKDKLSCLFKKQTIDNSIQEHLTSQCGFNYKGYRFIFYQNGQLKAFKIDDRDNVSKISEKQDKVANLLLSMHEHAVVNHYR